MHDINKWINGSPIPRDKRALIGIYNCSFSSVFPVCTHWFYCGFSDGFGSETAAKEALLHADTIGLPVSIMSAQCKDGGADDDLKASWQDCAETVVPAIGAGSTISAQALAFAEYLSGTGPWDEGGRFAGNNRYELVLLADAAIIS